MYSLFSVFTLFYLILENISTNVTHIDIGDVVYVWSICLLALIVLNNLFDTAWVTAWGKIKDQARCDTSKSMDLCGGTMFFVEVFYFPNNLISHKNYKLMAENLIHPWDRHIWRVWGRLHSLTLCVL